MVVGYFCIKSVYCVLFLHPSRPPSHPLRPQADQPGRGGEGEPHTLNWEPRAAQKPDALTVVPSAHRHPKPKAGEHGKHVLQEVRCRLESRVQDSGTRGLRVPAIGKWEGS